MDRLSSLQFLRANQRLEAPDEREFSDVGCQPDCQADKAANGAELENAFMIVHSEFRGPNVIPSEQINGLGSLSMSKMWSHCGRDEGRREFANDLPPTRRKSAHWLRFTQALFF